MSLLRSRAVAGLALAVVATGLATHPVSANPAGTGLVISEVYGAGGNGGATYNADFIELYNPTDAEISLAGLGVHYRSASGTSGGAVSSLSGSVPAGEHWLIQMSATGATGASLPTPDSVASPALSMAAAGGQVYLLNGTTPITTSGNMAGNAAIVDMGGFATATSFETAAGPTATATQSAHRTAIGADSDNNAADFVLGAVDPQNCNCAAPPPPPPVGVTPIAEIQGTGDTSPKVGQTLTTTGVVTAAYPTGGFNGFFIQTDGTGGGTDATPDASDALFVYSPAATAGVSIGELVEVTGEVSEFFGATQITAADAAAVTRPAETPVGVTPLATAYPTTLADREKHEGELLAPTNSFTVTNTYSTNQYAEIGLATGNKPLIVPTEVADAQDTAAINAVKADNLARGVVLDDGASINFTSSSNGGANKNIPLPWLSTSNPIRVGASATLQSPVILDYRNNTWKFQPTSQVTGSGASTATFANTRAGAPEAVPGNLKLATFNVLNYFNTTGVDFVAAGGACTYYTDREGNKVTNNSCTPDGPRGAAEADDLSRQQIKIVAAINALGADIVSLEEIENSVKLIGETNRDDALSTLVDALNTAAGSTRWAFAPSPAAADLPALAEQDVIRTAFIYNPGTVSLVGASKVLVGSAAFSNAREPLAQAFKPKGTDASETFAVIVNHFKSKGSGADDGTGQGNANPDRIAQAQDLVTFANDVKTLRSTDKVFLTGDFNAYTMEDPMQVLYDAGYAKVDSDHPNEWSYSFSGQSGSLDHVLASPSAMSMVAGADIWSINSGESVAFEYSRHNNNVTDFYQANMYRSSDHDPEIVGLNVDTTPGPITLNLLGVNDFHGRINSNTVKWAGTVEKLTAAAGADSTLLIGAGDLIGASEFNSAVADDQPTIDMFNALGLDASAVGNHEFDKGWADLRDRVIGPDGDRNAQWDYLGANVYEAGTTTPVMQEYATFEVEGVTVGVIGAVTEETSTLVSPGGITDLTFGNAADAVNRVAAQLSDGEAANGEADVIIASFHAGASKGEPSSSYPVEVAKGGEFAEMANLIPAVDAIFNGHTHVAYAWQAPVPGVPGATRPIIQTGQYGANVGQVKLIIDPATGEVTTYTATNVARTTDSDASLVAAYPRVAQVKQIVDDAIAYAKEVGNTPVGSISADITRAYAAGSFVDGRWVPTNRASDDRASESTVGDLVANALRDGLPASAGTPDLGIVNPGGLRQDLNFPAGDLVSNPANTDGVVTYAEANDVLPFVNNIWTIDLTGAQLKTVLEQQWQTNPGGPPPSRPFLALGLSDNVRVTQDPTQAEGSRITSVVINGVPLDPERTYKVSTFSFLGTGGDNFRAFTEGTAKDTGLVDREVWIDYLRDNADLAPDFARQQVVSTGMPASVQAGDPVSFSLSKLNLTSVGSPENTSVAIYLRTDESSLKVGDFAVAGGVADISFTAPADLAGVASIVAVASPSDTHVGLPLSDWQTRVAGSADEMFYGTDGSVSVEVSSEEPANGTVELFDGGTLIATAPVVDGEGEITVPGTALDAGSHELTVSFTGDDGFADSTASVTIDVAKGVSSLEATVAAGTIVVANDTAMVDVTVSAEGFTPTGSVAAFVGGFLVSAANLSDGVATLEVGPFDTVGTQDVEIRYLGNANTEVVSEQVSIEVVKATPTVRTKHSPRKVKVNQRPRLAVAVMASNLDPTGQVQISRRGEVLRSGQLVDGRVVFTLPKFLRKGKKVVYVTYLGDDFVAERTVKHVIKVRRR